MFNTHSLGRWQRPNKACGIYYAVASEQWITWQYVTSGLLYFIYWLKSRTFSVPRSLFRNKTKQGIWQQKNGALQSSWAQLRQLAVRVSNLYQEAVLLDETLVRDFYRMILYFQVPVSNIISISFHLYKVPWCSIIWLKISGTVAYGRYRTVVQSSPDLRTARVHAGKMRVLNAGTILPPFRIRVPFFVRFCTSPLVGIFFFFSM